MLIVSGSSCLTVYVAFPIKKKCQLWKDRLGFERDTLWLLLLPPRVGTQSIYLFIHLANLTFHRRRLRAAQRRWQGLGDGKEERQSWFVSERIRPVLLIEDLEFVICPPTSPKIRFWYLRPFDLVNFILLQSVYIFTFYG